MSESKRSLPLMKIEYQKGKRSVYRQTAGIEYAEILSADFFGRKYVQSLFPDESNLAAAAQSL
ncbi:MAG: hypothetical protein ACM34I_03285 [bacterium]